MAKNSNLSKAKEAKNDEFYTMLSDIEKELINYRDFFKGKVVYCNCDDCYESNFFKYFALNFNFLGLKKIITTCYDGSNVAGNELQFSLFSQFLSETSEPTKKAYKIEITKFVDMDNDGALTNNDIIQSLIENKENTITVLNGNGSFDSEECVELLKEADVVVTNPPFSLFRDFVALLEKYEKKFIIIGSQNATNYKEIFPLIKDNKLWLGMNMVKTFKKPDGTEQTFGNICWFTNVPNKKRNEKLILWKKYNEVDFPKYDNYDAINVDKVVEIPVDYDGVMGVPITFLDKYNPEQFEILWQATGNTRACCPTEILNAMGYKPNKEDRGGCGVVHGERVYSRILIKKK